MRPLALLIALCLPLAATAAEHLAVLELQNASPLPAPEVRYLTERVRGVAQAHPVPGLALMTRANLAALLPPGVDLADCEGECAVETGRIVGADYVVAGEVVSLGGSLRAILTLHAKIAEMPLGVHRAEAVAAAEQAALAAQPTIELKGLLR